MKSTRNGTKRRIVCALLVCSLPLAFFTGCAGGGEESSESPAISGASSSQGVNASPDTLSNPNITVFWPRTVDDHPEFTEAVEAFEKKYGGEVTVVGSGRYDDRATRLTNLVQSRTQVDVVFTNAEDYPSYALTRLVRPLDTTQFDFTKEPYTINDGSGYTVVNGDAYFVKTTDTSGGVLTLYNKTLIENAGLETPLQLYEEGNWNWNTFRELARNLSEDTDGDGINDIYGWADYDINALLASNGTTLLKTNGESFVPNDSEAATRAYQLYYDMYNIDNSICKDPWSWSTDMVQGKLGMVCQKAE